MNIVGASKGLTIDISFCNPSKVEIKNLTLIIPNVKSSVDPHRISLNVVCVDSNDKTVFRAELLDFNILDGFNEYSAKLSGKNQDARDSCCIYILFTPNGNEATLKSLEIEVIPNEYPMNKAI